MSLEQVVVLTCLLAGPVNDLAVCSLPESSRSSGLNAFLDGVPPSLFGRVFH